MKYLAPLALALSAMVACSDGSNVIGDRPMVMPAEDTGPSVNDGGNPADASPDSPLPPPMDAAITPDVNMKDTAVMRDVQMVIAGVGPMIMNGPFHCAPRLCRPQSVTFRSGRVDSNPHDVTCNADQTGAELSSIGFTTGDGWTTCGGNTCSMSMGGTVIRAIVYPMINEAECGRCGTVVDIDTATGREIPLTEGVRQSCPL